MEFSFEPSQAKTPRSRQRTLNRSTTSTGGETFSSDRLQKAIERNRAKQARRGGSSKSDRVIKAPSRATSSLQSRLQASRNDEIIVMPKKTKPTRRNVAVGGRASFSEPVKKTEKIPAPIRYLGLGKSKTKTSKKNKKLLDHLVIFGWITVSILGLRLLFSERGVIDFYKDKSALQKLYHEKEQVIADNKDLVEEIEKIKGSGKYQKKIVRDNLGFIAQQEYLILFAKGRTPASTN